MKMCRRHFFSLVELLVGMVILVMIMGFLFRFLFNSNSLWQSSINNNELIQQAQVVFDAIGQDLKRMAVHSDTAYFNTSGISQDVELSAVPMAWYGDFDFENGQDIFDFHALILPLDSCFFEDNKPRIAMYRLISEDDLESLITDKTISAEKASKYRKKYKNTIVRWILDDNDLIVKLQKNIRVIDWSDSDKSGKNTEHFANVNDSKNNYEDIFEEFCKKMKSDDLLDADVLATNVSDFRFYAGNSMNCASSSVESYFRANVMPDVAVVKITFEKKSANDDNLEEYSDDENVTRLKRTVTRIFNLR